MIQFFSKKMSKKRKGFTLIELVVVVAILGILAAIAIPRFTNTRANANLSSIQSNLKVVQNSAEVLAAEKNVSINDVVADNAGSLTEQNGLVANDLTTLMGNWPEGPGGVTYTFTGGEAIATLTAANTPPMPTGFTTQTTFTLDSIASVGN